jgi:hypothetical protein
MSGTCSCGGKVVEIGPDGARSERGCTAGRVAAGGPLGSWTCAPSAAATVSANAAPAPPAGDGERPACHGASEREQQGGNCCDPIVQQL